MLIGSIKNLNVWVTLTSAMIGVQLFGIVACKNSNNTIVTEKVYYPNGGIKMLGEYDEENEKEIVRHFYPNGKTMSYHELRQSQIDGVALHYYENGNIKDSLRYKNGTLEGIVKSYYPGGETKLIANYKNGKIYGELSNYYPNQLLESYCRYVKDTLHYQEKYDSLGNFKWAYTLPIVECQSDTFQVGDTVRFYIYHPAPDTSINYFVEVGIAPENHESLLLNRISENHTGSSFYEHIPKKPGTYILFGNVGFVDDERIKNIYPFEKKFFVIGPPIVSIKGTIGH